MSTDPKNWRPGDIVTVESVSWESGTGRTQWDVELWDRAPLSYARRGHCNPWWARYAGRWVIVECATRRNGHLSRYALFDVRAYDVHDRVLSGLAAMAAIPAAGSHSGRVAQRMGRPG